MVIAGTRPWPSSVNQTKMGRDGLSILCLLSLHVSYFLLCPLTAAAPVSPVELLFLRSWTAHLSVFIAVERCCFMPRSMWMLIDFMLRLRPPRLLVDGSRLARSLQPQAQGYVTKKPPNPESSNYPLLRKIYNGVTSISSTYLKIEHFHRICRVLRRRKAQCV
jgi:hypothetical protein